MQENQKIQKRVHETNEVITHICRVLAQLWNESDDKKVENRKEDTVRHLCASNEKKMKFNRG